MLCGEKNVLVNIDDKEIICPSQYIEAADLEPDTLKEDPSKYHEAWHQLVSAK